MGFIKRLHLSESTKHSIGSNQMLSAIYESMAYKNVSIKRFSRISESFGSDEFNTLFHIAVCSFVNKNYYKSAEYVENLWAILKTKTLNKPELAGLSYVQLNHFEGVLNFFIARNDIEKINAFSKLFTAFEIANYNALKDQINKIKTTVECFSMPNAQKLFRERLITYPF